MGAFNVKATGDEWILDWLAKNRANSRHDVWNGYIIATDLKPKFNAVDVYDWLEYEGYDDFYFKNISLYRSKAFRDLPQHERIKALSCL